MKRSPGVSPREFPLQAHSWLRGARQRIDNALNLAAKGNAFSLSSRASATESVGA